MNRRAFGLLLTVFLLFYTMNYLMPLAFGDDYLYAFIWQGKPMYVPLSEDAVKVSTFRELVVSQISFYYTWSGRVINNTLSQLFAWAGKDVFNYFNALASLLLIMEMYWCANKGKVSLCLNETIFCCLVLLYWAFTPAYPSVVFWLVGACHYLWPAMFLSGFLIPYIYNFYFPESKIGKNTCLVCFMFFWGVIAGCTNENSVCWIILLLSVFIYGTRKSQTTEYWMYAGLTGMVLGYVILMLSPGNYVRLLANHSSDWFNKAKIAENLHAFSLVLVYQFILWYFCLRSLFKIRFSMDSFKETAYENLYKELLLIKALCIVAMCMSACMVFSPEYHLRSGFPGTVQLMIATGIILRIQKEYGIELLEPIVKKFLACVGIVFFIVSTSATMQHLYEHQLYNESLLSQVEVLHKKGDAQKKILHVAPFSAPSRIQDYLSGYHTFDANLTEDADSWINVAFARYYGIKGIRIVNPEDIEPGRGGE